MSAHPAAMDWDELRAKVAYIRDLYRRLHIELRAGQGLARALDEAEALANGHVSPLPATDDNAAQSAHDAHVIWALEASLRVCIEHGLDLSAHLANIATGTTDFGAPSDDNRVIYFKDFEYELFLMASLIRSGLTVRMPEEPNDPCYEFECEGLLFQLKHPNSPRRTERLLRTFNRRLRERNAMGVFAVAVEDMFTLADGGRHDAPEQYDAWLEQKRAEMEEHGVPLIRRASALPGVAGLIQTQTLVRYVAGNSNMNRLGNSCIIDTEGREAGALWEPSLRVLRVFNPEPVRSSIVLAR